MPVWGRKRRGNSATPWRSKCSQCQSCKKRYFRRTETIGDGTRKWDSMVLPPVVATFALTGLGLLFVLLFFFGKLFGMPLGLPSAHSYYWDSFPTSLCFFLWWSRRTEKRVWQENLGKRKKNKQSNRQIRFASTGASFPFINWKCLGF